jgi:type I restriction enzyme M protein
LDSASIERQLTENNVPTGISAKTFNNEYFGYYKVNIERPDRRKAQFRSDLIAPLRFEKSLRSPMEYIYSVHGESVYEKGFFKS